MRISKFTKHTWLLAALFLMNSMAWAQSQSPLDIALRHIEQNYETWQVSKADVTDMSVNDQVLTKHNGVNHIYLMQRHAGVEVYNTILTLNILPNGEVFYTDSKNLIPNLSELINTTTPILSAYDAIEAAASSLGLTIDSPLNLKEKEGDKFYHYEGGSISNSDIKVKLRYQPVHTISAKGVKGKIETVRLAWDLAIDQKNNDDYMSMRVDASTGKILNQNNYTLYCAFEKNSTHKHGDACKDNEVHQTVREVLTQQNMSSSMMDASYNVFAWPLESPIHGDQTIEVNPHSEVHSPFGWHDTDGQEGAEFTITRGNNVHAFLDLDNLDVSQGDEPDGGESLTFDYPYDSSLEPSDAQELATVQLFYDNNMLHDFTANFGFDEGAGNFQSRNYTGVGSGGDYVQAHAQDGVNTGAINNANFATPPDGVNPTMQMYLWNSTAGSLTVNEPEVAQGIYETRAADFGATIDDVPLTGEVVIVNDGTAAASLGCEPATNDLTGKIALIDRGQCEFGLKALNAENAGAIGFIICNFDGGAFGGMAPGAVGAQVTIPGVMVDFGDCQSLRNFAGNGLEVSFVIPTIEGPMQVDGDLDNGIVAHEYGHGISNRLTAGPNNTGCLTNDEQMGEGWSDFFALVTSVRDGDTGEMGRGVGTFANRQATTGRGIRRQVYSTDMSVNTQTLNSIIGTTAPHPLGEVWAVTLWDMYWNLIDVYGYDADITNAEAGNNIAVQLVMDGMKMQGCNPGFIAGRDGILAADMANNQGANQCLIWATFARRGIGFDADGRDANNRNDHREGFEIPPSCRDEISITKEVTELIDAGDEIEVSITVTNYKDDAQSEVVISDEIADGTSYVAGSGSISGDVSGNIVSFMLGDLGVDEAKTITYTLSTDGTLKSVSHFYDDMEAGDENWDFGANEGLDIWEVTDILSFSGDNAWYVPNVNYSEDDAAADNDQYFYNIAPIEIMGNQPVLRFYHYYNTEWGFDGGHIEVSTDEFNWDIISPDKFFKNGYESIIPYGTLAIPNLPNFTGVSDENSEFKPVMMDFSDYAGQEVFVRFRFAADAAAGTDLGWFVDDIEVMDLVNYNGEACVTSAEGEMACATAIARGTIVQSDALVSNKNVEAQDVSISVQPNPASDYLNVSIVNNKAEAVNLTLLTVDGREVMAQSVQTFNGQQMIPVNVSSLAAGFYFVRVSTGTEIATEKVVIK